MLLSIVHAEINQLKFEVISISPVFCQDREHYALTLRNISSHPFPIEQYSLSNKTLYGIGSTMSQGIENEEGYLIHYDLRLYKSYSIKGDEMTIFTDLGFSVSDFKFIWQFKKLVITIMGKNYSSTNHPIVGFNSTMLNDAISECKASITEWKQYQSGKREDEKNMKAIANSAKDIRNFLPYAVLIILFVMYMNHKNKREDDKLETLKDIRNRLDEEKSKQQNDGTKK